MAKISQENKGTGSLLGGGEGWLEGHLLQRREVRGRAATHPSLPQPRPSPAPALEGTVGKRKAPLGSQNTPPPAHPFCLGQRPRTSPSPLPQKPTCHPAGLNQLGWAPSPEVNQLGPAPDGRAARGAKTLPSCADGETEGWKREGLAKVREKEEPKAGEAAKVGLPAPLLLLLRFSLLPFFTSALKDKIRGSAPCTGRRGRAFC